MQPFRVKLGLIGQGGGHFLLLCDLTLAATLPDDREREPPITDYQRVRLNSETG